MYFKSVSTEKLKQTLKDLKKEKKRVLKGEKRNFFSASIIENAEDAYLFIINENNEHQKWMKNFEENKKNTIQEIKNKDKQLKREHKEKFPNSNKVVEYIATKDEINKLYIYDCSYENLEREEEMIIQELKSRNTNEQK